MTFKDKLEELATQGGAIPYIFGSMAQVNHTLDKQMVFPAVIHIQSVSGVLAVSPIPYDQQQVLIGYADRIPLDYDEEQVEGLADQLKTRCLGLLDRINADGFFQPVETATYSVLFDSMDANLLIVLMTFDLAEAQSRCLE